MATCTNNMDHKEGNFSWKIRNGSQVKAFLNAKPTVQFPSEIFTIGGLQWRLYAYPSGKYPVQNRTRSTYPQEGCELYLELLSSSWPKNVYKITFAYRLFCSAANSSFTNIQTFTKRHTYDNHHRYFVNWFRGTLTKDELLELEGQIINLECYINILRMESTYKANGPNPIVYQCPYAVTSLKKNETYTFEWKINNIQQLFVNTKCGKHLESDIFNNFWCLRIAPRGWKLHEQKYVTAWLQLCALPRNIFKIQCKYTIRCIEKNITYSSTKWFTYFDNKYNTNAGWNQRALWTDSLRRLKGDTLTFECIIDIFQIRYDRNDRNHSRNNINNVNQYVNNKGNKYKRKENKRFIGNVNNQSIKQIQFQDKDEKKSSEIDELRQIIMKQNKTIGNMQQTINNLQFTQQTILRHIYKNDEEKNVLKMDGPGFQIHEKMKRIQVWLRYEVKLAKYIEIFELNGIDMDVLRSGTLNSDNLLELGVEKCDVEVMMNSIKKLENVADHNSIHSDTFEHVQGGGENINDFDEWIKQLQQENRIDIPCEKPTPFV